MKKTITVIGSCIALLCVLYSEGLAWDMDGVIAYPVPLNPEKSVLKIRDTSGLITHAQVRVQIFDINGDPVFDREFSISNLSDPPPNNYCWNGRNNAGRKVSPGLYIMKITAEGASGEHGVKILRILVDY